MNDHINYQLKAEGGGWMGSPARGAGMGRSDQLPANREADARLYLQRIRLDVSGYDAGGNYWGVNLGAGDMYCAWGEYGNEMIRIFLRAQSRAAAKTQVFKTLPNARFYR